MNYLTADPKEIMAKNGKSFYFASLIFSKISMDKVSRLYTFCRYVDDCADELATEEAGKALQQIRFDLENSNHSTPLQNYINQIENFGVQRIHLLELIQGAEFDVTGKKIHSNEDFIRYCYLVAGVVGLMMCPLIGVKNSQAHEHAISLGIGMQITNICRDVLEDAQNNRSYLPENLLTSSELSILILKKPGTTPSALKDLVRYYLDEADKYYVKGYNGLSYIPLRPRFCILIAGEVYRAIGIKIRKNNYNVLQGRTYLNLLEKIWVVIKTFPCILKPNFWKATAT